MLRSTWSAIGDPLRHREVAASGSWHGGCRNTCFSAELPADWFQSFTDRARSALALAQDEARHFNHTYMGTEHLLLGILEKLRASAQGSFVRLGATSTNYGLLFVTRWDRAYPVKPWQARYP